MDAVANNQDIPTVDMPRENVIAMITSKTPSLTEDQIKDLEIGIYNWTIEYANDNRIISLKFKKIYI
jgi:hypothetical protein